jgi:prepilin-type N-terminal cleavage/methylation domain-containing protein
VRTRQTSSTISEPESTDCSGFTLLELLVVLAMALVLAAVVSPAARKIFRSANRGKAGAEIHCIAQGLKAYRTALGQWPGQTQDAQDGTYADPSGHGVLLAGLTNAPEGKTFLEIPETVLRDGVWRDPWGRAYVIALDESGDGRTDLSATLADPPQTAETNVADTVAVMSWGPDPSDPDRRVCSWSR